MAKRLSTDEFIEKAKRIHGWKYRYREVYYTNTRTKITITCPEHGEFEQLPKNHLKGRGCPKCWREHQYTTKRFIEKANAVHNNKYNYSKTNYINALTKVIITCPDHGDFEQKPRNHLRGRGCAKCGNAHQYTTEEFIEKANVVHDNKYNYNKTNYINALTKVIITCPDHGEFEQVPKNHLRGSGCPTCNESNGEYIIRTFLEAHEISFQPQHKFDDCVHVRPLWFDFYLPDLNACIEFNGKQHYEIIETWGGEGGFDSTITRDKIKEDYCRNNNIPLLVIPHTELFEIDNILCLFFADIGLELPEMEYE